MSGKMHRQKPSRDNTVLLDMLIFEQDKFDKISLKFMTERFKCMWDFSGSDLLMLTHSKDHID